MSEAISYGGKIPDTFRHQFGRIHSHKTKPTANDMNAKGIPTPVD